MKDPRSKESWRSVSCSPALPSSTSWCAVSPRRRTECTGMPSTRAPRAPSGSCVVASGAGGVPASARAPGDHRGRACCGAGGRVDLGRVVQLDDLDRLEEGGGPGGESHHEQRPDGEVRRDEHADPGAAAGRRRLGELPAQRLEAGVVPAGRADDDVHAARDTVRDVGRARRGHGELDGDVRAGEVAQRVTGAVGTDEHEALGGLDGPHRLGAHASGRADHGHPDVAPQGHPAARLAHEPSVVSTPLPSARTSTRSTGRTSYR